MNKKSFARWAERCKNSFTTNIKCIDVTILRNKVLKEKNVSAFVVFQT